MCSAWLRLLKFSASHKIWDGSGLAPPSLIVLERVPLITVKFPVLANYEVRVIIASNFNAEKPSFMENVNIPTSNEGCCVTRDNISVSYIFLHPNFTVGDLAHEASHAINNLFRYIGAKSDEEIFAYHLQHLIEEVLKGVHQCHSKKAKVALRYHKTSRQNRTRAASTRRQ